MTNIDAATQSARVAWVTGASSGIGRAVALGLADAGWQVAASARNQALLLELAALRPGQIHPFQLDVTERQSVFDTVAAIESHLGPMGLAFFSAGSYERDDALDFDLDAFERMVKLNLLGSVACLKAAIEVMAPRKSGRIAVTASVAGFSGLPGGGAYGATKAALINLTESFRPELERAGITLHLVNPGFVKTPLTDKNDFDMPFLIGVEEAADSIVKGLEKDAFEIVFPWKMAVSIKLIRALPYRLFFALTRRMLRNRG